MNLLISEDLIHFQMLLVSGAFCDKFIFLLFDLHISVYCTVLIFMQDEEKTNKLHLVDQHFDLFFSVFHLQSYCEVDC